MWSHLLQSNQRVNPTLRAIKTSVTDLDHFDAGRIQLYYFGVLDPIRAAIPGLDLPYVHIEKYKIDKQKAASKKETHIRYLPVRYGKKLFA